MKIKLYEFFEPRLVAYDMKVLGIRPKVFDINFQKFEVTKKQVRDYAKMNPINLRFSNDKNMEKLKEIR